LADANAQVHLDRANLAQEAIMLDHHEAQLWADHNAAFIGFARRVAAEIGESFRILASVQYDQPWRRTAPAKACRRH
jgi:hypothetical protein